MSVCYPLWTRKNKKRHSSIMMEKLREGNKFIFMNNMAFCRLLWTWHLSTFHSINLVNHLVSESIHFHESCNSFESFKECIVCCRIVFRLVESMLPSILSCCPMFKGKLKVYLCNQNNLCVSTFWVSPMVTLSTTFQNFVLSFLSSMWDSSWTSFDETIHVDSSSSSRN